jgi:hypothetical protein
MRNPYINLTGQRFDRLVVTDDSKPSDLPGGARGRMWLCRCDCGGEKWVYSSMLRGGVGRKGVGTKSCGCLLKESGRAYLAKFGVPAPLKLPPGQAARRSPFTRYSGAARRRGFDWALTWEQFCILIARPCTYCGAPPGQREHGKQTFNGAVTYTGLDRQDNGMGYTPENTVACCGTCNYMKRAMSLEEFLAHVARINDYQGAHRATAD